MAAAMTNNFKPNDLHEIIVARPPAAPNGLLAPPAFRALQKNAN